MLKQFEFKNFRDSTLDLILQANEIIAEYIEDGYSLTLRQLYYQFVARGLIENSQREYKRLGSVVNDGRLAGLIDWDAIEDRTRNLSAPATWASPEEIVDTVARQYQENPWDDQPAYCEVWVEKEALAGVVERACEPLRVPHFSCRGYVSQSEQFAAGQRLKAKRHHGKSVTIFHLGDHDPSGIDMTRDNRDRLVMFGAPSICVERIALNMDQIEEHRPPPNPAKETDARFSGYREKFGDESYELDALDPKMLNALITKSIRSLIDSEAWEASMRQEARNRELLSKTSTHWDGVVDWLNGEE